jgi:hypothetical protein
MAHTARKCARHDAFPRMGAPRAAGHSPRHREVSLLARAGSFLRTVAVLHGGRQGTIADKVYLLVSGACDLEKSVVFARKRVGADGAQTTERHSRVVPVSTLRVCPPAERQTSKQTNEQPKPQKTNKQPKPQKTNKQPEPQKTNKQPKP